MIHEEGIGFGQVSLRSRTENSIYTGVTGVFPPPHYLSGLEEYQFVDFPQVDRFSGGKKGSPWVFHLLPGIPISYEFLPGGCNFLCFASSFWVLRSTKSTVWAEALFSNRQFERDLRAICAVPVFRRFFLFHLFDLETTVRVNPKTGWNMRTPKQENDEQGRDHKQNILQAFATPYMWTTKNCIPPRGRLPPRVAC